MVLRGRLKTEHTSGQRAGIQNENDKGKKNKKIEKNDNETKSGITKKTKTKFKRYLFRFYCVS